jgi:hypothetical protein
MAVGAKGQTTAGGRTGLIARFVDFIDARQGLLRPARPQSPGVDLAALLAAYYRAVGDGSRSKPRGADAGAREGRALDPTRSQDAPRPIASTAHGLAQAELRDEDLRGARGDAIRLADHAGLGACLRNRGFCWRGVGESDSACA